MQMLFRQKWLLQMLHPTNMVFLFLSSENNIKYKHWLILWLSFNSCSCPVTKETLRGKKEWMIPVVPLPPLPPGTYPCRSCDLTFQTASALHRHKRMLHSPNKAPQCKICGKMFWSNSSLKLHQVSHSDSRPFSCNKCKKSYKYKKDLRLHRC